MDELQPDGRELLTALAGALEPADLVPSTVLDAAKGAFTWRDIDAELAALTLDSTAAGAELAAVRSTTHDVRLVTFEASVITIELEVLLADRRIVGQLVPAQSLPVELRHGGGTMAVTSDELGRFSAGPIAGGPLRVAVRTARGRVSTETIVVP